MVDAQTIGVFVTAASVTVAAIYYTITLRITQRNMKQTLETRQAQFMMQLNESMTNVEVMKNHIELMNMEWTDLDDFSKKWGTGSNIDAAAKRLNTWQRFGFIGDLLKRNLFDREWLYEQFGSMIILQWYKFESIIRQTRTRALIHMLIVDGVRYQLWNPKDEENEFHPLVKKNYKQIFGDTHARL
jgi:hypothetical protein